MNDTKTPPKALNPPGDTVVLINGEMIRNAVDASRTSPRKRIIFPLHKSSSDRLHRMLNAVQPGSYIRPHRHLDPPKAESFIVLKGSILLFIFNDTGDMTRSCKLSAESPDIGIDIEPGIYHSFAATIEDTVLFEVKTGPYRESTDKDFAAWAPAEGSGEADAYLKTLCDLGKNG